VQLDPQRDTGRNNCFELVAATAVSLRVTSAKVSETVPCGCAILPQMVDDDDFSDDSGVPEDFLIQLEMPDRDIELDSGIDEPIYV